LGPSPADDPPLPLPPATWAGSGSPILLGFDKPLQPDPILFVPSFAARLGNQSQTITGAQALAGGITVARLNFSISVGPNFLSYTPASSPITGANGLEVAAFNVPVV